MSDQPKKPEVKFEPGQQAILVRPLPWGVTKWDARIVRIEAKKYGKLVVGSDKFYDDGSYYAKGEQYGRTPRLYRLDDPHALKILEEQREHEKRAGLLTEVRAMLEGASTERLAVVVTVLRGEHG